MKFKSGLISIGIRAFDGCSSLSGIKLPDSVESIGRYAFEGTPWRENAEGFVVVGNGILIAAGADIGPEVLIPENVLTVGDAFENRTDITSLVVPSNVLEIGSGAFMGCLALEKVTLPTGLTAVENWCFANCEVLKTINLENLTEIGSNAFFRCSYIPAKYQK